MFEKMKNLKIVNIVMIGFLLLIILTTVVGISGLYNHSRLLNEIDNYYVMDHLAMDMAEIREAEKNFIITNDREYLNVVYEKIEIMEKEASEFKDNLNNPSDIQRMDNILVALDDYKEAFTNYVELHDQNEASFIVDSPVAKNARILQSLAEDLRTDQKSEYDQLLKSNADSAVLADTLAKSDDANQIVVWVLEMRRAEKNYLMRNNEVYIENVNVFSEDIITLALDMKSKFNTADNKQQAENIAIAANSYKAAINDVHLVILEKKKAEVHMAASVKIINDLAQAARDDQMKEMMAQETRVITTVFIVTLIAIVLGVIFSLITRRTVDRGINVTKEYIDRISKGDIPVKITEDFKGDFNEIKNNLNIMIDRVGAQITNLCNIPIPVMTIDKDFNVTYVNIAGAQLVGRIQEECNGKKCYELFKTSHCNTPECCCLKAMLNGNIATGETEANPGGRNIPIKYTGAPIKDRDGNIIGALEYMEDITELKTAMDDAAKKVEYLNCIPTPVYMIDKNMEIQYINPAGAKAVGRTSDVCIGQKCFNLFNTGHCNTPKCQAMKAMQNDCDFTNDTIAKLPTSDCPIRYTGTPVKDMNGNIIGALGYITTIAEEYKAVAEMGQLVEAALDGRLDVRGNPDNYKIEGFRNVIQGTNDTLDAVINPLNMIVLEIEHLVDAAVNGRLEIRGDPTQYKIEGFRNVIQGINDTLDAVIGPLNMSSEYLDRISKGDIPDKITDEYKGDFNEIKNSLNLCIDAINAIVTDINDQVESSLNGDLKERIDASRHSGDFKKVILGINNTLDAVINPLEVMGNYIDRISKGDIPEPITDEYNGKFNDFKTNVNLCIHAINAMLTDMEMLSKAAKDGKLDISADASKHGGNFNKIVQGVNDSLEAVLIPVQDCARILRLVASGNLTQRTRVQAKGQLQDLLDDIDTCVDSITDIVSNSKNMADRMSKSARSLSLTSLEMKGCTSEMSTNIQLIADGALSQSEQVNSTCDTMLNIEKMVNDIANKAQSASKESIDASNNAQKGGDAAGIAVVKMKDIQHAVGNSSELVQELGVRSGEIGEIVSVITSIAEKTNLLALNAGIEAARAGDKGLGFAKVADEVHSLAEESKEAAKGISNLIKEIQNETVEVIRSIESGNFEVEEGTMVVNEALEALESIAAGSHDVAIMVEEISAHTQEQQNGIKNVVKSIDGIAYVAEQSASSTEETLSVAQEQNASMDEVSSQMQELDAISNKLIDSLSVFTISKTDSEVPVIEDGTVEEQSISK